MYNENYGVLHLCARPGAGVLELEGSSVTFVPREVGPGIQSNGICREWWPDDGILYYLVTNTARVAIDALCGDIEATLQAWPSDVPLRMMIDLRSPRVVISAYAVNRAREMNARCSGVRGRCAVLTSSRAVAQIVAMTLRAMPVRHQDRMLFSDQGAAVAWLLRDATMNGS